MMFVCSQKPRSSVRRVRLRASGFESRDWAVPGLSRASLYTTSPRKSMVRKWGRESFVEDTPADSLGPSVLDK